MSLKTTPVEIQRSAKRRKTIAIQVRLEGIVVKAPARMSDKAIHALLAERDAWIQAQLTRQRDYQPPSPPPTAWEAGEAVLYLGEPHILETAHDAASLKSWYLERAKTVLEARTAHYASLMEVMPARVIVKTHKARWGSCSSDNVIRYNWKIIQTSLTLIDYLVVHELAHIRFKHHGPAFWAFVARFIPNPKACRKALRELHYFTAPHFLLDL